MVVLNFSSIFPTVEIIITTMNLTLSNVGAAITSAFTSNNLETPSYEVTTKNNVSIACLSVCLSAQVYTLPHIWPS